MTRSGSARRRDSSGATVIASQSSRIPVSDDGIAATMSSSSPRSPLSAFRPTFHSFENQPPPSFASPAAA